MSDQLKPMNLNDPSKLVIVNTDKQNKDEMPLQVLFNPGEYSISKGAEIAEIAIPGLDSPLLQYVRGTSETLTVTLFFDTTGDGTDVRDKTKDFYELARINSHTHALPKCMLHWGLGGSLKGDREPFTCVVQNIEQNFTLFSKDGIPLRAELSLTFKEYRTLEKQVRELQSYTRARIINRGDTLSSIAAMEYNNPGLWRLLARANNITNPARLTPGTVIQIPPVEDRYV
ncbi:MAG: LysM peptidoglycan-binding domain-containing protein [Spirochaetales bacterium]|nr:LysM peptidoglycan-binding domain-containing protein [Spirochaetales bacterium]